MWFASPRTARRTATIRRLGVERLEDRCQPSAGVLDPTFGTGGQVTPAVTPTAVLVQPWDGKIVLAGSTTGGSGTVMSLARYNSDGTLDASFGSGGKAVSTIAGGGAAALYPQAGTADDGKIVEVGGATVARFNANGSVDTTFGKKGVVTLPWTGTDGSVVIQADGKIVVSGAVSSPSWSVEVTRLNANGSVDTTFGTRGTWQMSFMANTLYSSRQQLTSYATIQADGKLIVTKPSAATLVPGYGWNVYRLTTSGAVDPTFQSVYTTFGSVYNGPDGSAVPDGVAVYPATDAADAGKILAVGHTNQISSGPPGGDTVLARYNSDGTLDATFGQAGKVIGANSGSSFRANRMAIQADGKAVVVGTAMQRYNTNGTLDATFGGGGIVSTAYSTVAVQPDGRIDVADPTALARYLASEPQIGSFTADPNPVTSGGSETLTVSNITDANPNASITQVAFYYIDGNGVRQTLGYGTQTSPGVWTLTFTIGLPAGSYTVFAQAEDSYGVFGDPVALTLQVV